MKYTQVVVARKDNGFISVCYTMPEEEAAIFVKAMQGNITFDVKSTNTLEITTARKAMADLLDNVGG